jgi:hypothetical protein
MRQKKHRAKPPELPQPRMRPEEKKGGEKTTGEEVAF